MTRPRLFFAALLLLAGCANPVSPSGGPPDQTPPVIVASAPADGAVNVSTQSVQLTFSEFVDPGSFASAFSVTPAFDESLDFDWRRRRVEITFPQPLRENTTYILTLDTDLRDVHSVALRAPVTLAFSTGPEINQGQLTGRVLDPRTGDGLAEVDVYAYARPDSTAPAVLPERPDYRTQTGEDGQFLFEYLEEQPYFVIALQDRNRSRTPDAAEPFAVPPQPVLVAETTTAETPPRFLLTVLDTLPPVLQRVRALSPRHLELRFSEPVRLAARETALWQLQDSLRGQSVAIHTIYARPNAPTMAFLQTDSLQATTYQLHPGGVVDTSGNPVAPQPLSFAPALPDDTLRLRFLGFRPDTLRLLPGQVPGLQFNQPVDEEHLQRLIAVRDTTDAPRGVVVQTTNGTTYRLQPEPPLAPQEAIRVTVVGGQVAGADTTQTRTFRRISDRALGDLSGVVAADTTAPVLVELYPAGTATDGTATALTTVQAGPDGRFSFTGLPEGTYRFRIFLDRDEDGRWDGGQLLPYAPPEPLAWGAEPIEVRARWVTEPADTLRIAAGL